MRNFAKFIGEVDNISLIRDCASTKSNQNSSTTKIHFQNLLRPSPTLFIRHWNEEKLDDMKVGTETFYSFIQSMIHKLKVNQSC